MEFMRKIPYVCFALFAHVVPHHIDTFLFVFYNETPMINIDKNVDDFVMRSCIDDSAKNLINWPKWEDRINPTSNAFRSYKIMNFFIKKNL